MRDIDAAEMEHEAALLVRTAFERFDDLQAVDVWATIPVDKSALTSVENTVFSVSADRATYAAIRDRDLSDGSFLAAFGRALPRLSRQETLTRLHFVVGAMAHTMLFVLQAKLPDQQISADGGVLLRELLAFAAGGLCSPAAPDENTEVFK